MAIGGDICYDREAILRSFKESNDRGHILREECLILCRDRFRKIFVLTRDLLILIGEPLSLFPRFLKGLIAFLLCSFCLSKLNDRKNEGRDCKTGPKHLYEVVPTRMCDFLKVDSRGQTSRTFQQLPPSSGLKASLFHEVWR